MKNRLFRKGWRKATKRHALPPILIKIKKTDIPLIEIHFFLIIKIII